MSDTLEKTCYLILAKKNRYHLKSPQIRTTKPALKPGEVCVRLDLKVPQSLFETFIPVGTVTIPAGFTDQPMLEVEVPEAIHAREPGLRLKLVPVEDDEETVH